MLSRSTDRVSLAPPLAIKAAGQWYRQTTQFLPLGGVIHESADVAFEIDRRMRLMCACLKRFGQEFDCMATARCSLRARTMKTEVVDIDVRVCDVDPQHEIFHQGPNGAPSPAVRGDDRSGGPVT